MSTVLITASALASAENWPGLRSLRDEGLEAVVVGSAPDFDETRLAQLGVRRLPPADGPPTEAGLSAEALAAGLALSGRSTGEAFLVCNTLQDCLHGESLGWRTVLVLGGQPLDVAIGPGEPANKAAATAPRLDEALRYVTEEHRQNEQLGPFPYGPAHAAEERPAITMPTGGDLAKIFGLSVVAGVAVALGIAYLLQEVYQSVQFPRIFYYLTLQFIPQTLRGLMFLLIGAGAGLLLPRLLSGLTRQRRSYP